MVEKQQETADKLHEKAKEYRTLAERDCDCFNHQAEKEAVDEFENGKEAKYFRHHADYVTGLLVERLEAARKGEKTFPLRPFDAETLARLLSTCTEAPYEEMRYDVDLSDEELIEAYENDKLISTKYSTTAATPTTERQRELCAALLEYSTAAAVYAKHIGSSSLLEWVEMIDILDVGAGWWCWHPNADQALRLIELEKSAANRLRMDKIISELPRFNPPAKKLAKTVKKAKK